jgi:hypothetical protein
MIFSFTRTSSGGGVKPRGLGVLGLLGILLIAGVSSPGFASTRPPLTQRVQHVELKMSMNPYPPGLGDTVEVVVGALAKDVDLTKALVYFESPGSFNQGLNSHPWEVLLMGCPSEYATSLEKGVWKEFRFKFRFVSSPSGFQVGVRGLEVRQQDGTVLSNPQGYSEATAQFLVLSQRTKKFYPPGGEPPYDPYAELQKELGLPDQGFWYSVAVHLRGDLDRYADAKGMSYGEAKAYLVQRAERMAREDKVDKPKAYDTILTHRLLWKEAGLPDPSAYRPHPQDKDLVLESEVKSVAHNFQLAVEDFKMTPGREGIKPTSVRELKERLPKTVLFRPNPFNPKQNYSPEGGALVDGNPQKPGQVGYIFKGQDQPYVIQGLGKKGKIIILLDEGP